MVREFTMTDLPDLLSLAKEMHEESRYSVLEFRPKDLRTLTRHVVSHDDWCGLVAVNQEGAPVGMLVGYVTRSLYGRDTAAEDFVVFVSPSHRGGTHAVRMLKEFYSWAKDRGVKEVRLNITTGVHTERTRTLYERLGYETVGYVLTQKVE